MGSPTAKFIEEFLREIDLVGFSQRIRHLEVTPQPNAVRMLNSEQHNPPSRSLKSFAKRSTCKAFCSFRQRTSLQSNSTSSVLPLEIISQNTKAASTAWIKIQTLPTGLPRETVPGRKRLRSEVSKQASGQPCL